MELEVCFCPGGRCASGGTWATLGIQDVQSGGATAANGPEASCPHDGCGRPSSQNNPHQAAAVMESQRGSMCWSEISVLVVWN